MDLFSSFLLLEPLRKTTSSSKSVNDNRLASNRFVARRRRRRTYQFLKGVVLFDSDRIHVVVPILLRKRNLLVESIRISLNRKQVERVNQQKIEIQQHRNRIVPMIDAIQLDRHRIKSNTQFFLR